MTGAGAPGGGDVRPTAVTEDYLKAIWTTGEWSATPVTGAVLAARLRTAASTVSETVRRLADEGLVRHAPYRPVTLTPAGRRIALDVVRRHRLLETYLVRSLGYGWHEVHDEADRLEHVVSDRFVERIDVALGRPRHDPHGDPIPDAHGAVHVPVALPLAALPRGATGHVVRVSDADPEVLCRVARLGLVPDARVQVVQGDGGPLHVVLDAAARPDGGSAAGHGEGAVDVGPGAADAVWVRATDPAG